MSADTPKADIPSNAPRPLAEWRDRLGQLLGALLGPNPVLVPVPVRVRR